MATKDKGNISEGKVRKIFEAMSYLVAGHGKKVNWIFDKKTGQRRPVVADQDIFGAFDLIAISSYKPTTWIQVCSNNAGDIAERKRKIEEIAKHMYSNNRLFLFAYEGGRKTLDRRYKKEKRFKPWDFFQVYELTRRLNVDIDKEIHETIEEWVMLDKIFCKPQLDGVCWICKKELVDRRCPDHEWAGQQVTHI
jgi:hypothetical protein